MDHSVNLFNRFEQVLFDQALRNSRAVSCVIITGYLGSGKTTLLNNILRQQSALRLAVLVNEVGAVDIDGQLVNIQQANASVGAVSRQLAGGCACCEVAGDLQHAVKQLLASSADVDYVVLETSGAADVEPMVDVMHAAGLQVDGVVAVVDADAALEQLESGVAVQQVQAADLVVLNKCDLASLGQVADAEDRIRAIAPGVKIIRARHAQVDPAVLFDLAADDRPMSTHPTATPPPSGAAPSAPPPGPAAPLSVSGQVAFMSHESAPVLQLPRSSHAPGGGRSHLSTLRASKHVATAPSTPTTATPSSLAPQPTAAQHPSSRPEASAAAHPPAASTQHPADHHPAHSNGHHHHAQDEQHEHRHQQHDLHQRQHQHHAVARSVRSDSPLSLAWFQDFVTTQLLPSPGLLRAKGILWFREESRSRYVFHLSGRRRVECGTEGGWASPPSCQLVLIGQSAPELERLCGVLEAALQQAGACPAGAPAPPSAGSATLQAAALRLSITHHPRLAVLGPEPPPTPSHGAVPPPPGSGEGAHGPPSASPDAATPPTPPTPATTPPNSAGGVPPPGDGVGEGGCCMVEFGVVGAPLHGVFSEVVNAELLTRVNGAGGVMLSCRKTAGAISAASLRQNPYRVVSLQYAVTGGTDVQHVGGAIQQLAAPVLRKAFAHAHNCGCDVPAVASG